MILILSDIHGDYRTLQRAIDNANEVGAAALIQIGDFGLFRGFGMNNEEQFKNVVHSSKCPVYFIDGNHDDCTRWTTYTEVSQVYPELPLYYVPRGTVMDIDNRTLPSWVVQQALIRASDYRKGGIGMKRKISVLMKYCV